MTIEEINKLADEIVEQEIILATLEDTTQRNDTMHKIETLCQLVTNFEDMLALDEALMIKLANSIE